MSIRVPVLVSYGTSRRVKNKQGGRMGEGKKRSKKYFAQLDFCNWYSKCCLIHTRLESLRGIGKTLDAVEEENEGEFIFFAVVSSVYDNNLSLLQAE